MTAKPLDRAVSMRILIVAMGYLWEDSSPKGHSLEDLEGFESFEEGR